jgi:Skp family chaperone for outer membrane proteins
MPDDNTQTETAEETFVFKGAKGEFTLPTKIGDVDMRSLLNQAAAAGRADAARREGSKAGELENRLAALEQERNELAEKARQYEEANLSAADKQARELQREREKFQRELEATRSAEAKHREKYQKTLIERELYGALSQYDLVSPQQTAVLIRTLHGVQVVEDESGDRVVVKVQVDGVEEELAPREAVGRLLALPEYQFHLKANVRAGSGTPSKSGTRTPDGQTIFERSELRKPEVMKDYMKLKKEGARLAIRDQGVLQVVQ